jgi:predicted DNA-binding transcriptional regulator AlpA
VSASLERAAALLETAARELRKLAGTSGTPLAPPRGAEAECDVPGTEPAAAMAPPISTETSPSAIADLPMLLTRAEVVGLLRIHPRTFGRLRVDPEVGFPEPVRLGSALRWRRTSIMRWLAARAG